MAETINNSINKGKYELAIDQLQKAIDEYPENINLHKTLCSILSQLNKYDETIIAYDNALKLWPDDFILNYNMAVTHYSQAINNNNNNNNTENEKLLNLALYYGDAAHKIDPNNFNGIELLKGVYQRLSNYEKAREFNEKLKVVQSGGNVIYVPEYINIGYEINEYGATKSNTRNFKKGELKTMKGTESNVSLRSQIVDGSVSVDIDVFGDKIRVSLRFLRKVKIQDPNSEYNFTFKHEKKLEEFTLGNLDETISIQSDDGKSTMKIRIWEK